MGSLDPVSDEELVRQARASFEANNAEAFQVDAGILLERYRTTISGLVYRRLSKRGAEGLFRDVVQDVYRDILAQFQAPRLKPGFLVAFRLTVNTTCRDAVEIALRHAGYSVKSRHAEPRVAQRPDAVPYKQQVSLNQPTHEALDDATLEEVVADESTPPPDVLAISRVERIERMRSLSPEQRIRIAVYGDYQDRQLTADVIAARRGLSIKEVKRNYSEACEILRQNKEHPDE